jgi:hypothetical protein
MIPLYGIDAQKKGPSETAVFAELPRRINRMSARKIVEIAHIHGEVLRRAAPKKLAGIYDAACTVTSGAAASAMAQAARPPQCRVS